MRPGKDSFAPAAAPEFTESDRGSRIGRTLALWPLAAAPVSHQIELSPETTLVMLISADVNTALNAQIGHELAAIVQP